MSTILIVEDSQPVISLLTKKLILEGFDCEFILQTGTYSRESIVDDIIEKAPDLIILDLNMPGTGGIAILEELRHREKQIAHDEIPIVILTALDADEEEIGYLKKYAQITEFVQKPIQDIEKFITLIKDVLSKDNAS